VDETSGSYVARRRELDPAAWYTRITTNTTWRGGRFLDPIAARHSPDPTSPTGLCAQWTYPNVGSCVAKTGCADTCSGFGIGGKLDRLDYLFVSDGTGRLARSRLLSAETDDTGARYSDHKGTRVSVALE